MKAPTTNAEWALHYRVSERSVNRMKRAGVCVKDPAAVATWLSSSRIASPQALERVIAILDKLPAIQL